MSQQLPGIVDRVELTEVLVVVPARNEERLLPRCLQALQDAADRLAAERPGVAVRVVVVLDRCSDGSAEIVAGWPGVVVVVSDHGRVGTARALGVDHGLGVSPVPPPGVWIGSTDADSAVPPDWLLTQLRYADEGVDLVLGTVRPDPAELPDPVVRRWLNRHDLADGHPHVHAANLGVRADIYRAVGGFAGVDVHEDVFLATAVRGAGGRVVSTGASPVLTSARVTGRTPGGMAGYLSDLAESDDPRWELTFDRVG